MKDVTVVMCHIGEQKKLDEALESLYKFYPGIDTVIDDDPSLGHGRKLDDSFKNLKSRYILTMDDDIRLFKAGLIEDLLEKMASDVYGVGELVGHHVAFIHPKLALWNRSAFSDKHLSFQDCQIWHHKCDEVFELQTGAYLGYQMSLKYGYRGVHVNVLDWAHHLSEGK